MESAGVTQAETEAGKAEMKPPTTTSMQTAPEAALGARERAAKTLDAKQVNIFYGDFHAVEDVTMKVEPKEQGRSAYTLQAEPARRLKNLQGIPIGLTTSPAS